MMKQTAAQKHGPSFRYFRNTALAIGLFGLISPAAALEPAPLFSSHAVIPAGKAFPVWGRAEAGEAVTVSFAGQTRETKTTADGTWEVMFPALPVGTRGTLEIRGSKTITLDDVAAGEIWLCSGQSNMQWDVSHSDHATEEIATADFPDIRQFAVPLVPAAEPRDAFHLGTATWRQATPANVGNFSAVAYFFARHLHRELKVPVGIIHSSWGGTMIQPWMTPESIRTWDGYAGLMEQKRAEIAAWPQVKARIDEAIRQWQPVADAAKAEGREAPPSPYIPAPPDAGQNMPENLYYGMIHPLIRLPIHGVLWYQGESNAIGEAAARQYPELQRRLITGWRKAWNCGEFPFYFVQLANFKNPGDASGLNWAWLREAQQQALDLPHTAMATAVDIGNSTDIHPTGKQELGRRLALLALHDHYGKADVICRGPEASAAEPAGNGELRVRFQHADGGLITRDGQPPSGFEIAGADMRFVPAEVRIDNGTVVLKSPEIAQPIHIRHAFANDPKVNLTNRAGLPALPFRISVNP
jgi:sialate O-acetylesterase